MKCRFYLLFFNLLLNLITPHILFAPSAAPTSDITGVTLTTPLTVEQQLRLGLDVRDARVRTAQEVVNRAFSGAEVVTAADLAAYAPSIYNAQQGALKAKQDIIDKQTADYAAAQATIAGQNDALKDADADAAKDEQNLNIAASVGTIGTAALAGGIAYAAYKKKNKPTLRNVARKLDNARKLTIQMARTPRKQRKLARAVAAFGEEQHQTTLDAIQAANEQKISDRPALFEDIAHRSARSHEAITGAIEGAQLKVRNQQGKPARPRRPQ